MCVYGKWRGDVPEAVAASVGALWEVREMWSQGRCGNGAGARLRLKGWYAGCALWTALRWDALRCATLRTNVKIGVWVRVRGRKVPPEACGGMWGGMALHQLDGARMHSMGAGLGGQMRPPQPMFPVHGVSDKKAVVGMYCTGVRQAAGWPQGGCPCCSRPSGDGTKK